MVAFVAPYHVAWRRPNTVNLSAMRRDPETMDPTLGALVSTICARNLTVLGLDSLALLGWNISESSPRRGRVLRRYFVPARLVVRGHDIRPVENVKDSWLLSTGRAWMLSESQISPNWIAWSGRTGLLAADAGHHSRERRRVRPG